MKTLLTLSLLCAGTFVAQDRTKKLTADDLPKVLQSATKAFEAKRYAGCARELKSALGLLGGLVRQQMMATMPAAPAGFTAVEDHNDSGNEANPFAPMLGLLANPAERTYRKQEGDGELKISIMPEAPMAGMLAMAFNMAGMDKSSEVVTYGSHKGMLRKEGERLTLQILVNAKDLIDVNASGMSDEVLLKVVDQAFVDRVVAALQN
jgi:hypothetical protein